MAILVINTVQPLKGEPDLEGAYARELADGLEVTFTIRDPEDDEFNTVFEGEREALETIIWRYITPVSMTEKGAYLNPLTADSDAKQEFLYFSNIWDSQEEFEQAMVPARA